MFEEDAYFPGESVGFRRDGLSRQGKESLPSELTNTACPHPLSAAQSHVAAIVCTIFSPRWAEQTVRDSLEPQLGKSCEKCHQVTK